MDLSSSSFRPPRRLVFSLSLCLIAGAVSAQGFPGGGGMMGKRDGPHGERLGERAPGGKVGEPVLRSHVLAVFADALERESLAQTLPPPAAQALRDFIRELKDFAALDDRHVRERVGLARGTVHAAVDLQRDLGQVDDSARELAAAAADVMTRWKALRAQLDDAQFDRLQAVYRSAISDATDPRPQPAK